MIHNYLHAKSANKMLVMFLLTISAILPMAVNAQSVLQNESFESATIFPAPGWRQQKAVSNVNGAFSLQAAATAANPACGPSPGGGTNVMMLNCYTANLNDSVYMVTKPFDFSNNGGNNPTFSFYMYRDNGWLANDDKIQVWINTVPNITGATLLTNTLGTTEILRRYNGAPVAVANTWNQYTYSLPAATYNGIRYYFIFTGICKDGNNIYLDQVQTLTWPSPTIPATVSMNLSQQNGASVGVGINNHMIVGIRCIVGGASGCGYISAVPASTTACKLDSILMNTNGTTNVLDIDDAKIYYTGGSPLFDTTYVSPFPVTAGTADYPSKRFGSTIAVPGTNLDFFNAGTSCFYLEYDTTYFWLTYDIKPTATGGNYVDADLRSFAVGGDNATCPSTPGTGVSDEPSPGGYSLAGASQIDLPYCVGTYTVGTSWLNGSYTNNDFVQSVVLNGAFGTAINTNFQGGMPYPSNNNVGLPSNLPCLVSNGGPGCDFTAFPPSYELWPAVSGRTVVLIQGTGYTVTVQAGTWVSSNNIAAFIDFNRDGDFLDAGEKLGQVSLNANLSAGIAFAVPAAGYTGVTRMRVREVWASSNITPCDQFTYGEIEDFTIIISPSCPVGYKLWLGNTDDWNNPGNWCGGVPTITDDAVVDRAQVFPPIGTPTRPYYRPTIKSTIAANCNNLTISTLDSVLINAPAPAANALKIKKDLNINGRVKVTSNYTTNVTYSNGTLNNSAITPFKGAAADARTQIIYQASELTLSGLVNGDQITGIRYTVVTKGSAGAYNGFTIGYALIPNGSQHLTTTPNPVALTTVYNSAAYFTALGVNTITLTTPIVWDGSSNILIQYCYDNVTAPGSNNDVIQQTQTTGIGSILCLSNNTGAATGCTLSPLVAGTSDNFWSGTKTMRPNFTFLVNRPYTKAILRIQEDWVNNGAFEAGYSRVVFDSTIANTIGGTQNTTFCELEANKGAASQTVTMLRPVTVDTSVVLSQGKLVMNSNTLTMNNPGFTTAPTVDAISGPFTRTNGYLISENATSSVIWKNLSSNIGYRVIPFGVDSNSTNVLYIPFSFFNYSGTIGDFTVSTYAAPGNLPLPPGVTHLNSTTGVNNAASTADRFWIIGKTGANPVTRLTFRYRWSESPVGINAINPGKAQPWRTGSPGNAWIRLITPWTAVTYTQNWARRVTPTVFDSVSVANFDWPTLNVGPAPFNTAAGPLGNVNPWAISVQNSPLPIELMSFDAKPVGNRVRLNWSTASEINNDFFTVERATADKIDEFDFISKVNSQMNNSTVTLNYESWDNNPVQGLQYYRLKQTDFDGQYSYSDLRPVYFGKSSLFDITNVYAAMENAGEFKIEFIYNTEAPLDVTITDVEGRVVYSQSNVAATPGANTIYVNQQMPHGVYFVVLRNNEQTVNRKFFY